MITVYCEKAVPHFDAVGKSDQNLLLDHGVFVTRGIFRLKRRKTPVLITNFTKEYQHLNKDASVAFLQEINEASEVIGIVDFQPESDDARKATHFFDVNPAISPEKQEK